MDNCIRCTAPLLGAKGAICNVCKALENEELTPKDAIPPIVDAVDLAERAAAALATAYWEIDGAPPDQFPVPPELKEKPELVADIIGEGKLTAKGLDVAAKASHGAIEQHVSAEGEKDHSCSLLCAADRYMEVNDERRNLAIIQAIACAASAMKEPASAAVLLLTAAAAITQSVSKPNVPVVDAFLGAAKTLYEAFDAHPEDAKALVGTALEISKAMDSVTRKLGHGSTPGSTPPGKKELLN